MARHNGTNLAKLVIPLFAGVAAAAAFLLPGPAPMLLASQMHADFGWMILIGLCAAIPGMIIAGPLWGNFISRYVELHTPDDISEPHLGEGKMPSFGFSLALILLPLVLVGLKTIAARFVPEGSTAYEWFEFIGHPFTAILVACLVAIYGLAVRQGMAKDRVMEICGHALQPAGIILLVIGAGVVGLQAIATAKRLGGVVKAMDIRPDARREAGSLKGTQVVGFEVPPELAMGEGGYAKALPADWLEKERALLRSIVPQVDIIILSALIPGEVAPILITTEMVKSMKPGSVIVDVSIDQGGNCQATVPGKEVLVDDVYVCGTANIPGSMAVDASWLYAQNMLHYIENLFPKGPGSMNLEDEIVRHSLVTKDGRIVHQGALKAMGQSA
jgi:hypothetical protein